ncbi:MAG: nuclear transport factor 2 family protein, partial [Fibrella sp.]|nr:nuclear transport factor 2 family protein [Armatimonadota bacterium]
MTPDEVTTAWLDAYNARDPHALIALYHDDAEVFQVAAGPPLRGREALLENFAAFFAAFPDNYTNPVNVIHTDAWSIVEWQGGGTFLGKLGEWEPTGRHFEIRGCGFF